MTLALALARKLWNQHLLDKTRRMPKMRAFLIAAGFVLSHQLLPAAPTPGSVVAWGRNLGSKDVSLPPADYYSTGLVTIAGRPLTNAVAISAGGSHGLGITSEGLVAGWGANLKGEA